MNPKELSKTYEPHQVEDHWIDRWLQDGVFSPRGKGKPYSIVIPPPNVTGSLHMGHALNNTLQDILIRFHRMMGDQTLWVVGTDHAGIATQNVVERQIKEEGKTRFDLGREKFVERVWKWKEESGGTILNQLKRLGASCDFNNERFTMDDGLSRAVRKVFVQLYQDGLIYRDRRLINWCPRCHTALSDLEVEHEETKGNLWKIKYLVVGRGDILIVATTRPETLLGDVAVAVHPEDERYKHLVGQKVKLPLTDREIPIIADGYVDRNFGSGVVKITPAHDFNDFEIGKRHGLAQINILTDEGRINENGGIYQGLTIREARRKILADLLDRELLDSEEQHTNAVGHCYRCREVVEPYLSLQWFVKTKPLAEPAIEAVKSGKTRFVPKHWEKTYFNWMENIQDWCISRQIWWGHQIPVWYCQSTKCSPVVSEDTPSSCPICGSKDLVQDPDVLDTWFSSALWPFSTLGWPEITPALKTFYPTSVLITAFDIIFFWVARMMMMGLYFMKEVPFKDIHIHALVRDPLGQKMSKSKGNVVDPLLMMKKYGTDAFRFTLAAFAAQGRDIKLDEARIEGYRNFCNKIWNASRFALMNAASYIKTAKDFHEVTPHHRVNQWILEEHSRAILDIRRALSDYEFNRAAMTAYNFFWHDLCDWYLEFTKEIYKQGNDAEKEETAKTTYHVLDSALRLMHPFMPFITEEIWQMLADRKGSIALAPYPEALQREAYQKSHEEIQLLVEMVNSVRSIRQETGVPLTEEVRIFISTQASVQKLISEIEPMLRQMGKIREIQFGEKLNEPSAIVRTSHAEIFIPLQGLIDVKKEKERQIKKLVKIESDLKQIQLSLTNPDFVDRAPAELIEEKKAALSERLEQKELIEMALKNLG